MPAPKGHERWGNPLKPKKYTPQEVWDIFLSYLEWNEQNPIMVVEQSKMPQRIPTGHKGNIKQFLSQLVHIPHERALSIERFCIHANISRETFDNYSKVEGYETYFDTCKRIREFIDSQHFEGGMAGTFNANITARKLGLIDKNESTLNMPAATIVVQSQDAADALKKLG